MNLQMLALQTIMRNGGKFKETEPVFKNIIFDVDSLLYETELKTSILKRQVNCSRRNLYKTSEFSSIQVPDTTEYDKVVDQISNLLFDDMSYDMITTHEQLEWKEYFHGLYDMVIFPYHSDRTHYIQMINELYKYFNILKPPEKQLLPGDPLYIDVMTCRELFRKLKVEHKRMVVPKLFKKMKKSVEEQVRRRLQHKKLELKLKKLVNLRSECLEMLKWSTSSRTDSDSE